MMIIKKIIKIRAWITYISSSISIKTRKETTRFLIAFFIAWVAKTLLNEFPFFTQLLYITHLNAIVQNALVGITVFILEFLGFSVINEGKFIAIEGTFGIRYELACLAFRHFTLFIFFILIYYGKILHKVLYVLVGSSLIMLINAIRGSFICISQLYFPDKAMTIHDIISPWFMYLTILFLWLGWVKYFGHFLPKQKS